MGLWRKTDVEKKEPLRGQAIYKVVLKEELDPKWSEWFEGLTVGQEEGRTTLVGPIRDQAALHGLFHKIRDLNLTLMAVIRIG